MDLADLQAKLRLPDAVTSRTAPELAVATWIAYLLFYTGFDKATKSLKPSLLLEVLTFKSPKASLVQLNKVRSKSPGGRSHMCRGNLHTPHKANLRNKACYLGEAGADPRLPRAERPPISPPPHLTQKKKLPPSKQVISLVGLTLLCLAFLPGLEKQKTPLIHIATVSLWIHAAYSVQSFYGCDINRLLLRNPKRVAIMAGQAAQAILVAYWLGYVTDAAALFGALTLGISHFYLMERKGGKLEIRPFAYLPFLLAFIGLAVAGRKAFHRGKLPHFLA